ncbi:MAG: metallophosphoesterase [Deltaproteobacteria bacterium]|nr:metallophosphoesterase [Deltaproteobacteria bacterium]
MKGECQINKGALWCGRILVAGTLVLMLLTAGIVHAKSFKFAVICDTRSDNKDTAVNTAAVTAICKNLKKRGAKFVLAPGDFFTGSAHILKSKDDLNNQYQKFIKAVLDGGISLPPFSEAKNPAINKGKVFLYPVRGNHESYYLMPIKLASKKPHFLTRKNVKKAWIDNIGKYLPQNGPDSEQGFTYSFIFNNSLFIGLDQYIHTDPTTQKGIANNLGWLKQQLQLSEDIEHVFVFGHTPAFAAQHSDCLAQHPYNRDEFLRLIKQNKGGIYFCGHDHFYARAKVPVYNQNHTERIGHIQQIITPSGAPFLENTDSKPKWSGEYNDPNVESQSYIDEVMGYQLITVGDDTAGGDENRITVQFVATKDGSTHTKDDKGVYKYTYGDNGDKWKFEVMDSFVIP